MKDLAETMSQSAETIALFPLKTVLFPGGRLPLQIFEQRYLDLIRLSLRTDTGFGVCLLRDGEEMARAGVRQQVHRIGTYARVVDWDQLPNGLLGVTVEGRYKFVVQDSWAEKDQLLMASVLPSPTDFAGEESLPVDESQAVLVGLLEQLVSHPVITRLAMNIDYGDLRALGWRLSELIPMPLERKQALLELDDPYERIQQIEQLIESIAQDS